MAKSLVKATDDGFAHLTNLLKQVKDAAKAARGDLSKLDTTDKTNLVNALNEVKALINNKSQINDSSTASNSTWSSSKINTAINTAISNLINGADVDSDTLKELADRIAGLAQADNGLVSTATAQAFSDEQKQQARDNISVYGHKDIGNIDDADFVATINSAYTA